MKDMSLDELKDFYNKAVTVYARCIEMIYDSKYSKEIQFIEHDLASAITHLRHIIDTEERIILGRKVTEIQ